MHVTRVSQCVVCVTVAMVARASFPVRYARAVTSRSPVLHPVKTKH